MTRGMLLGLRQSDNKKIKMLTIKKGIKKEVHMHVKNGEKSNK